MQVTAFLTSTGILITAGSARIWVGDWSVPALFINGGFGLSLAGLLLPLVIAAISLRGVRISAIPRSAIGAVMLSMFANVGMVLMQARQGFPGGGVHLLSFVPMLPALWLYRAWVTGAPASGFRLLPGLTLLSMLPVDVFGSVLLARQSHDDPLHGLQWVGGAGWHDGLLLGVVSTAVIAVVASRLQRGRFSFAPLLQKQPVVV